MSPLLIRECEWGVREANYAKHRLTQRTDGINSSFYNGFLGTHASGMLKKEELSRGGADDGEHAGGVYPEV
jgi:hypothetical protein